MSVRRFATVAILSSLLVSASVSAQTPAVDSPVPPVPTPTQEQGPAEFEPDNPREQLPLGSSKQPDATPDETRTNFGIGSWGLKTAMALGVVVLLIFLLRAFLRRATGMGAMAGGGLVDVLARTPIGPKTQVLFLKINDRVIVAGQTPAGINTLAQIDQPEEVAAVLAQVHSAKDNSISQGFSRLLASFDRGGEPGDLQAGQPDDEHAVDRARGEVSSLTERLRKLKGGKR